MPKNASPHHDGKKPIDLAPQHWRRPRPRVRRLRERSKELRVERFDVGVGMPWNGMRFRFRLHERLSDLYRAWSSLFLQAQLVFQPQIEKLNKGLVTIRKEPLRPPMQLSTNL